MSNYDQNTAAPGFANGAMAIDVGLRAFMLRVYNYMAAGVGLTGRCRVFDLSVHRPSAPTRDRIH
jgi:FtsH-binding integral membrane protein